MRWPVAQSDGVWSAGAGTLLGIGLLHPLLWPATLIGLGVFLLQLKRTTVACRAFWLGWVAGSIKSGITLLWFFAVYPLDWMQLPPGIWQLALISLYWVPAALTLGLGTAAFSYIYVRWVRSRSGWRLWFSLPLGWLLGELLGAIIFSIYTLGPGSGVQTYFSFGFVGYALAAHPWLLSFATVAGVYSLTMVAVLLTFAGIRLVTQRRWGALAITVAVVWFSSWVPYTGTYDARGLTIGVLEMDWPKLSESVSPRAIDEVKVAAVREGLVALTEANPQQVVLPEDVRLTLYQGGLEGTLPYLTDLLGEDVVIVDSGRVDREGTYARAFLYDTGVGEAHTFDKQYLVPQGEYVPYIYRALLSLLPLPAGVTEALAWTSYTPGRPQGLVPLRENHPAVLFCFESVQPTGVRVAVGNRQPPYVAHIVSHAWFSGEPHTLWHQLDAMLKVQAVWSGLPIVQAANATDAKIYLPTGEIVYPNFIAEGAAWRAGLLKL